MYKKDKLVSNGDVLGDYLVDYLGECRKSEEKNSHYLVCVINEIMTVWLFNEAKIYAKKTKSIKIGQITRT